MWYSSNSNRRCTHLIELDPEAWFFEPRPGVKKSHSRLERISLMPDYGGLLP